MRFKPNFVLLTMIICLGTLTLVAQKQPDPNTLESKSGEELLNLIRSNTNAIKAEGPAKSEVNAFNGVLGNSTKAWRGRMVADCNGQVSEDSPTNYSGQCADLAEGLRSAGSTEKEFKALLLGCWWDSSAGIGNWGALVTIVHWDGRSGFGNCAALASELIDKGNNQAAKLILSEADGCHGHNQAGDPKNLCFATAIQHRQLFQDDELKSLALDAYSRENDPGAARYLASIGTNADVVAADANYRQASQNDHQARQDQLAADDVTAAQRQQQKADRLNAIIGAIQSAPGAGPDSIQQAASQQEANLRAIGDANAARQQQAAQARIAANIRAQSNQVASQVVSTTPAIVPPRPPGLPTTYTLMIAFSGPGSAHVTSTPAGIDCPGSACTFTWNANPAQQMFLDIAPSPGIIPSTSCVVNMWGTAPITPGKAVICNMGQMFGGSGTQTIFLRQAGTLPPGPQPTSIVSSNEYTRNATSGNGSAAAGQPSGVNGASAIPSVAGGVTNGSNSSIQTMHYIGTANTCISAINGPGSYWSITNTCNRSIYVAIRSPQGGVFNAMVGQGPLPISELSASVPIRWFTCDGRAIPFVKDNNGPDGPHNYTITYNTASYQCAN